MVRTLACHARGRGFEPHPGRQPILGYAFVAQLVEQRTENPRVDGSIPSGSTKCGFSSSGRAPPCQGGGSEFEPRSPLQKETPPTRVVLLFGAFSICAANRPPAATFIEKRKETRKGFPRKHPLPREERRILHSSDAKNLLPTPMREAHFNQR